MQRQILDKSRFRVGLVGYLRVVYGLRYSQSELRSDITVSEGVSPRKLPRMLLIIHAQEENLQLGRFEDRRPK